MNCFKLLFTLSIMLYSFNSQAENILRLATTTSTENSGLLAVLNPVFEKKFNCRLDIIAVGTGKALKLGENGDVDVLFVHAPKAELAFVNAGHGVERTFVMYNDFVLVGAKSDLAKLKSAVSVLDALQKIALSRAEFISRGDDSGTHKKEKALWQMANLDPAGPWYVRAGQGMGAVLKIADEKQAYTLTDRGTYLAFQGKIDLQIMFENDPPLHNPYHIIAVNPEKHPHVKYQLAKQYMDFITSDEGQAIIANVKMKGQTLFYADVISHHADKTQVNDEKLNSLSLD
ncbi:MAG: tungsten ABC transporter substrate-binding protein [Methylococcales symbiont of Hymedesmia sp. n. MRB-2018]|nr:MAG: tungsten ABC transporter substrate-binding protein [Methylococcales symbiont of Hymedesmia sp. n. MRB-2018]KAF3983588.1 MAG: tungsten ABC transporter substrate-binding protein [Methylococcales symbiont of Hymedesmia sp. n. MRB-2018]